MKNIISTIIITVFLLATACNRNIPNNSGDDSIFKLTDMKITARKNDSVNSCNTTEYVSSQSLNTNDSCKYNKFHIHFYFEREFIEGGEVGRPLTKDTIKNIVIISNNDYNENYN